MKSLVPALAALLCILGFAACETVSTTPKRELTEEEKAKLPPIVIVTIDSNYDSPSVMVNGFNAGYAPRDIFLEVNPDGTLPYAVTISVDPSGHSDSRAAAMLGSTRGPQVQTKSYAAGRVPPRKIFFDAVAIREDGQATTRAKPGTAPTATRED